MKTIKDVFNDYRSALNNIYDVNEQNAITMLVTSEVCGISKARIKAFPELEIAVDQQEKLASILAELKTGKPVQYIFGKTEFYGLTFYVNPSVLIPRPETEELVEWVIETVRSDESSVGNLLDIGTGSGCIAISVKKKLPGFRALAIDISEDALKTAALNATLNQVDIEFIKADILSEGPEITDLSKASIIISNPPYVTLQVKTQMHANVTDFEPPTALFVPEDDPLLFYKAIADFAVCHLIHNGLLFFEINESYGSQTVELLAIKGFIDIELRKDMSCRDRMVKARHHMTQ